jgi:hypothetical protein
MARLMKRILGLIAPMLLLSSSSEPKAEAGTHDIDSITDINQIKLTTEKSPFLLKLAKQSSQILIAGHSSHSSHSSHYSHSSGSSGSYSPSTTETSTSDTQSEESSSSKKNSSQKILPSTSQPGESSSSGAWRSTTEWKGDPNKLFYHEVIIILQDSTVIQGLVTDSKSTSVQLKPNVPSGSTQTNWIEIKNIKELLWR